MEYRDETRKAYDRYAQKFADKFKEYAKNYPLPADFFLEHLEGKKILDLGAGAGDHALYFKEKGYDVLCGDISERMVEMCRKKGLRAEVMDIENMEVEGKSYNGVWAYTSLLHIPRDKVPEVIKEIAGILRPNGIFALAVKQGEGEGFESSEKYPGERRWFTYFTDEEIRGMTDSLFEILKFSSTEVADGDVFLNYIFKLK